MIGNMIQSCGLDSDSISLSLIRGVYGVVATTNMAGTSFTSNVGLPNVRMLPPIYTRRWHILISNDCIMGIVITKKTIMGSN